MRRVETHHFRNTDICQFRLENRTVDFAYKGHLNWRKVRIGNEPYFSDLVAADDFPSAFEIGTCVAGQRIAETDLHIFYKRQSPRTDKPQFRLGKYRGFEWEILYRQRSPEAIQLFYRATVATCG
jgi:hypothetical protein